MGSNQDIMHGFVRQEINRLFSRYDGWNLTPQEPADGYNSRFVAERTLNGKRESKNILVSFENALPAEEFEPMRTSRTGDYGQKLTPGIALILPQQADISTVPGDVTVYFMKSFAIRDGTLMWLKRPLRETTEKKEATLKTV